LQIPVFISAIQVSWNDVVNRIAFHSTMLTSVTVALQYALPDLAPLAGAAIVLECACH
jgi:hypothetical protein